MKPTREKCLFNRLLGAITICGLSAIGFTPLQALGAVETFIGRPSESGSRVQRQVNPIKAAKAPGGRFSQLDRNRDGRVSRQEMEEGNRTRLEAFARADTNADGHLSKEEWRAYRQPKATRKRAE